MLSWPTGRVKVFTSQLNLSLFVIDRLPLVSASHNKCRRWAGKVDKYFVPEPREHGAGVQERCGDEGAANRGKAVQVETMKSMSKAPGTKRLKLKYDKLLPGSAFIFNLRR
jgi:hypothetical protein